MLLTILIFVSFAVGITLVLCKEKKTSVYFFAATGAMLCIAIIRIISPLKEFTEIWKCIAPFGVLIAGYLCGHYEPIKKKEEEEKEE